MSLTQPSLEALAGLPPRARRAIYAGYGVLAVIVSAIQVGFAALPNTDQPIWLTVTLAVVAFLAIPVAALAAVNVVPNGSVEPTAEPRRMGWDDPA